MKTFSPHQISRALGVSESTIKRWIDAGHLRAEKTPGGHRRITIPDVLAFLRARGRPVLSLEALGLLAERTGSAATQIDTPERLAHLLLAGETQVVSTLLFEQYSGGRPMDEILDRLVGPAMAQVGIQWAEGTIDVYEEHAATLRMLAILHELRALIPAVQEDAPLALGGAPEGDPYFLPTCMAELTLADMGWRALNLGPNTPMMSVLEAISHYSPRLVWLSITSTQLARAFFDDYPRMFVGAQERGMRVAVGGQGVTPEVQDRLIASAFGTRLAHLKAFARGIER